MKKILSTLALVAVTWSCQAASLYYGSYDWSRNIFDSWDQNCQSYWFQNDYQTANFITGQKHHYFAYGLNTNTWSWTADWAGSHGEVERLNGNVLYNCSNCGSCSGGYTCQMYEPEDGQMVTDFSNHAMAGGACSWVRSNATRSRWFIRIDGNPNKNYTVIVYISMDYLKDDDEYYATVPETKRKINSISADSDGEVTLTNIPGNNTFYLLQFSAADNPYGNMSFGDIDIVTWYEQ